MKKGFTLVEAVIAAGIMALAIASFIGAFMSSKYSAVLSDRRMIALHDARSMMEYLMTLNYGQLVEGTNAFANGIYTVTPSAGYSNTVKDVVVTVNWVNPGSFATSSLSLCGSVSYELHQP